MPSGSGFAVLGDKDAASCVDKVAVQVVEAFDVGNAHAYCRRDVGQAGFGGRRIPPMKTGCRVHAEVVAKRL